MSTALPAKTSACAAITKLYNGDKCDVLLTEWTTLRIVNVYSNT